MKIIGITGGIGSGKSTVMNILSEKYGVKTILADELGAKSMLKGCPTYQRMIEEFGEGILDADKEIDKNKLAAVLFADKSKLEIQNGIVHPFVKNEIKRLLSEWIEVGEKLAAVESAILTESGCDDGCDEIWLVTAPESVRIERLMKTRCYSEEKAGTIIANQKSDDEYKKECDKVIINDKDIKNLYEQLEKSIEQLTAM